MALASLQALLAQRQVNTQVNTSANQPLYHPGTGPGAVRYSTNTSMPMDSELRHAYYASGSTPSDVRFSYSALGARTPGGPMRYLDYKPSYLQTKAPSGPPPQAPPTMGSVRYASGGSASPNMVTSQRSDARVSSSAVRVPGATRTAGPSPRVSVTPSAASAVGTSYTVPSATRGCVRYAR